MRYFVPVLLLSSFILVFQNCGRFSPSGLTPLSSESEPGTFRPRILASDCRFGGGVVSTGQSVRAFLSSTVPGGQTCDSETRVCNEGVLSGSYAYTSCAPALANSDCLFDGQQIPHGGTVTAFATSTAESGACVSETRRCGNGSLSGTFAFAACSAKATRKDCSFNGQQIFDGEIVKAFPVSSVGIGSACVAETRTCVDGVLSGSATFAACAVNAPKVCVFEGESIAHGGSVRAYAAAQPARGAACAVETRTCNDGVLSGSAPSKTCTETPFNSCRLGNSTIAHGQSIPAFAAPTHPSSCTPETRVCNDGVLSGSNIYTSCTVTPEASCAFNGGLIASRESVTAYKNSSPAPGTPCERETRVCNNGTLSGSYTAATCQEDVFEAACKNQPDGTSYYAFNVEKTALNEPCRYEIRTCGAGKASGSLRAVQCETCHNRSDSGSLLNSTGATVCFKAYVDSGGQPKLELTSGILDVFFYQLSILVHQ